MEGTGFGGVIDWTAVGEEELDVSCTSGYASVIWSVEIVSITLYTKLFVIA